MCEVAETEWDENLIKRAADLRDELLFKQPKSSHLRDCPNFPPECCSKLICIGCHYANEMRRSEAPSCPFCREPLPKAAEQCDKRNMKRIQMNIIQLRYVTKEGTCTGRENWVEQLSIGQRLLS